MSIRVLLGLCAVCALVSGVVSRFLHMTPREASASVPPLHLDQSHPMPSGLVDFDDADDEVAPTFRDWFRASVYQAVVGATPCRAEIKASTGGRDFSRRVSAKLIVKDGTARLSEFAFAVPEATAESTKECIRNWFAGFETKVNGPDFSLVLGWDYCQKFPEVSGGSSARPAPFEGTETRAVSSSTMQSSLDSVRAAQDYLTPQIASIADCSVRAYRGMISFSADFVVASNGIASVQGIRIESPKTAGPSLERVSKCINRVFQKATFTADGAAEGEVLTMTFSATTPVATGAL